MAVKAGMPVQELTSLSALLKPDIAERVLDAYWEKNRRAAEAVARSISQADLF